MRSEIKVELFQEEGFVRKKCKKCGRYFWTLREDLEICTDQPCGEYWFIGNPPTNIKSTLNNVREKFLTFFEKRDHERIRRYPVVARWRDDVYLVGASIYDFQPWVTEGIVPPPANPLTISQPCIRLTDIGKVGRTGRHLTTFEMMAHHAFNFGKISTYWIEDTVRYSYEFFTKELKIPPEHIVYIEDWWSGGGNAGEDFEVIIDGLEVATLVFMHYKTENGKIIPMNNYIIDTGYGLERIFWLLTGKQTVYDAIFGGLVDRVRKLLGVEKPDKVLLGEISKLAGKFDIDTPEEEQKVLSIISKKFSIDINELIRQLNNMAVVYRLLDHSRALVFMLGDGIVPSNTGEGYLARLVLRRVFKDLVLLGEPLSVLKEIIRYQIDFVSASFPEYKELEASIIDIVDVEEQKFKNVIERGRKILKSKLKSYRKTGKKVSLEDLYLLYDSHGVPPEIVSSLAKEYGYTVEIPPDFYAKLAERHEKASIGKPIKTEGLIPEEVLEKLPPTQLLYYRDPSLEETTARVLKVLDEGRILVLDQTIFYPEGGGAVADTGIIYNKHFKCRVKDVQKQGKIVVHICSEISGTIKEGDTVYCKVDLERRKAIMRAHTATHIILSAARRVLGKHVWQHGAFKEPDRAHLDITHYKKISPKELTQIEELANKVVRENRSVIVRYLDRNEAERLYGFTIYQGGIVPEKILRIVEIEGWDVQACGGLHCNTTGEIGFIKIVKSERIQDGVERLEYYVGEKSINYVMDLSRKIEELSSIFGTPTDRLVEKAKQIVSELKDLRKERDMFARKIIEKTCTLALENAIKIGDTRIVLINVDPELGKAYLKEYAFHVTDRDPNTIAIALYKEKNLIYVFLSIGKSILSKVKAEQISEELTKKSNFTGGGRNNILQGVIKETSLDNVKEILLRAIETHAKSES